MIWLDISRGSLNEDQNHLKTTSVAFKKKQKLLSVPIWTTPQRLVQRAATTYLWWAWTRARSWLICGAQTVEDQLSTKTTADTGGHQLSQRADRVVLKKSSAGKMCLPPKNFLCRWRLTSRLPDWADHLTEVKATQSQNWTVCHDVSVVSSQTVPYS